MAKKNDILKGSNLDNKEKETLKNIFECILGERVPSSRLSPYVKTQFGEKLTNLELIAIGQILKAQNERDTKASEFIRDTLGQKPGNEHKITGSADNPFVITMSEELAEWAE